MTGPLTLLRDLAHEVTKTGVEWNLSLLCPGPPLPQGRHY